jgi:hypothetical protein
MASNPDTNSNAKIVATVLFMGFSLELKKGGEAICLLHQNLVSVCLLADRGNRTGGNASATVDASTFITISFAIYHAERSYGTYVHAGSATDAGFFINLYCHDKTPYFFVCQYLRQGISVKPF